MGKGDDAYRSIGETAQLIGVATHVLRYWETQFPQLNPIRRPDGRRYYRPDDVRFAAALARILHDEGMTTRGATRIIRRDGLAAIRTMGAERLSAPETRETSDHQTDPSPRADAETVPRTSVAEDAHLARLANLSSRLWRRTRLSSPAEAELLAADIRSRLGARPEGD